MRRRGHLRAPTRRSRITGRAPSRRRALNTERAGGRGRGCPRTRPTDDLPGDPACGGAREEGGPHDRRHLEPSRLAAALRVLRRGRGPPRARLRPVARDRQPAGGPRQARPRHLQALLRAAPRFGREPAAGGPRLRRRQEEERRRGDRPRLARHRPRRYGRWADGPRGCPDGNGSAARGGGAP